MIVIIIIIIIIIIINILLAISKACHCFAEEQCPCNDC